jgi:glycosyltransferase involved in cell wall biosynthesis
MRIAVVNGTRRKTGGVETYLEQVIPALVERGHAVACVFEHDAPAGEPRIGLHDDIPVWIADGAARNQPLADLKAWRPDMMFLHSPVTGELSDGLLALAPGVFFAHNYHGTCISGLKRHAFPQTLPCEKVFSAACLAHYFPRRCGGLNPVTMIQRYRAEKNWLARLRNFSAILVASEHMAREYRRHGFGDKVRVVGLPVAVPPHRSSRGLPEDENEPIRLLFLGRMEEYKGGELLLRALPEASARLRRKLHLTFAGAGRERTKWELLGRRIMREHASVAVEFTGWLSGRAYEQALESAHLLTLPSLWPEPFGLVGLEAGAYGLPTAAFDVGGISEWLQDGVIGHLAPGKPPTAQGFAEAICRCVVESAEFETISSEAVKTLDCFTMARHLEKLDTTLSQASSAGSLRPIATKTC